MENFEHNQQAGTGTGTGAGVVGREERDLLISRIIDADDAASWARFNALGAADASAWRDLAAAQRDHALLSRAVAHEVSVADAVELPTHAHGTALSAAWSAKMARWGGWAVAAAIAFAWAGSVIRPPEVEQPGATAGFTVRTADDALGAFRKLGLDSGRLVGEVPDLVMVDSKPAPTGQGFEIVYIRQFVERAVVPDLYRVGTDEVGNPVPVPVMRPVKAGNGV